MLISSSRSKYWMKSQMFLHTRYSIEGGKDSQILWPYGALFLRRRKRLTEILFQRYFISQRQQDMDWDYCWVFRYLKKFVIFFSWSEKRRLKEKAWLLLKLCSNSFFNILKLRHFILEGYINCSEKRIIYRCLTHFMSLVSFYTLENIRKPEVSWCFQGV